MALKDKIFTEGMRLTQNPAVAKLLQDERFMKLETNTKTLPAVGTPVKLILEVPAKK